MKTASFKNILQVPFTAYWNGKPRRFLPGQEVFMEEGIARVFAKHLTNQILLEQKRENDTSPKKPEQVPAFMNIFNQCFKAEEESTDKKDEKDALDAQMDMANRNRGGEPSLNIPEQPKTETAPAVAPAPEKATPPGEGESTILAEISDDDDENAEFPELKQEETAIEKELEKPAEVIATENHGAIVEES